MVTDMMILFVMFRSLHQGHHLLNHLENHSQRPGKITPPTTMTKQ